MEIDEVTRTVRSFDDLDRLLSKIEEGQKPKPDWIDLEKRADLGRLDEEKRVAWLQRLHHCVLRGFRANDVRVHGRAAKQSYWTSVARQGFHDFAEDRWMKAYDSPFRQDYDYITPYVDGGLDALDPYVVYSAVLGTWEYSVEDFVNTELCRDVRTIVEPLAGSAEFCHAGHFRFPDFRYCMFDLDPEAKRYVEAQPWLERTERAYLIGDALEEKTWQEVRAFSEGPSLSYIGKQSQNYFDVKQLVRILEWGTTYTDFFMLEVSEPYLLDEEPALDDLTRPEMKRAGFKVGLEDVDGKIANPLTNAIDFFLVAWDRDARRELFSYRDWTGWQAATLTALGRLLDLDVRYFHVEETEFLSVDEGVETSDCRNNNTFMLFRRRE
jgi:hypothetical protein